MEKQKSMDEMEKYIHKRLESNQIFYPNRFIVTKCDSISL